VDKLGGSRSMLRQIGFFHFCGEDRSDPVGSLRASLVEAARSADISGALVVTPEGFNIPNGYLGSGCRVDPLALPALAKVSAEFKIALVAGLIESKDAEGPGYSSAYLIDSRGLHLLTRKMKDDQSGNYKLCSQDCDRPTEYGGASVAALICMDAAGFKAKINRHTILLERMAFRSRASKILCIPSHMLTYDSAAIAQSWPEDVSVVLANSSGNQPSVLRFGTQQICEHRKLNVVWFAPLP
jgi:predicted amidohydrolase